ncbi:MAG: NAD(P)-dependent alcohol dehydrogenase [Actinomycetota bacterium]
MRAAVCRRYGGPEVVELADVPMPSPGDNEVLVRVTASTVNRTSASIRAAIPPFGARLAYGLTKPRRAILGTDFAGTVERVGSDVRGMDIGDRVFGFDDRLMGAHAEFAVFPASAAIHKTPDGVSDEDAAACVEGAHYASTYVERAALEPGQRALVYGGGGAIGTAAIQLLRAADVEVVAVAEGHQLELMTRLGAAEVVDVRVEDFTTLGESFDLVLDAVGKTRFGVCRPLLRPGGMFMATELGPRLENIRLAVTTRVRGDRRVHFPLPRHSRRHVAMTGDALANGTLQSVIDRRTTLDQIVEAYRYVDAAAKTGSVVLRVADA